MLTLLEANKEYTHRKYYIVMDSASKAYICMLYMFDKS